MLAPIASDYWTFKNNVGGTTNLVSTDSLAANPAVTDVRYGTSYASGASTGTMRVPVAAQVRYGVQVDATTGTGYIDPAAFWDYARSSATTVGSMGERLRQVATVAQTGAMVAAFEQQPV
jgi:hypothetical protein